jgi:quercetin dioxygenase-like cupin family protein
MHDTTIKKVESATSPQGEMGQRYLVSGKSLSMRLWVEEPVNRQKEASTRDYETVGFVISGKAELEIEGQTITLTPGDSWLVPEGASHRYKILEAFTAVEATSPPAEVHGRDEPKESHPTGEA